MSTMDGLLQSHHSALDKSDGVCQKSPGCSDKSAPKSFPDSGYRFYNHCWGQGNANCYPGGGGGERMVMQRAAQADYHYGYPTHVPTVPTHAPRHAEMRRTFPEATTTLRVAALCGCTSYSNVEPTELKMNPHRNGGFLILCHFTRACLQYIDTTAQSLTLLTHSFTRSPTHAPQLPRYPSHLGSLTHLPTASLSCSPPTPTHPEQSTTAARLQD